MSVHQFSSSQSSRAPQGSSRPIRKNWLIALGPERLANLLDGTTVADFEPSKSGQ
ncbi:MAG: hypothetical protein AAGF15_10080 [Pseudomonadota bacterium]